jgi:hypothetical protein
LFENLLPRNSTSPMGFNRATCAVTSRESSRLASSATPFAGRALDMTPEVAGLTRTILPQQVEPGEQRRGVGALSPSPFSSCPMRAAQALLYTRSTATYWLENFSLTRCTTRLCPTCLKPSCGLSLSASPSSSASSLFSVKSSALYEGMPQGAGSTGAARVAAGLPPPTYGQGAVRGGPAAAGLHRRAEGVARPREAGR